VIFSSPLLRVFWLVCAAFAAVHGGAWAQELPQIDIGEAFIDLRTGPGDDFPVVQVAGRHDVLTVLIRHAGWVKVRTARGFEGWAPKGVIDAADPKHTLARTWRDTVDELLSSGRSDFGLAWGRYNGRSQESVFYAVRAPSGLGGEAVLGEGSGVASGLSFWRTSLLIQPWEWHGFVPGIGAGIGRSYALTGATTSAVALAGQTQAVIQAQLRYSVRQDWLVTLDWTDQSRYRTPAEGKQFQTLSLGVAFAF
jgi:hypothetical protein